MQGHPICVLWVDLCTDVKNAQDLRVINQIDNRLTIRAVGTDSISFFLEEEWPQVICLDYDFPDRKSLSLLRTLRCDYPSTPIVMITTQHSENLAVWAFRTGVRDYLVKPLLVSSLIETMNRFGSLKKSMTPDRYAPRRNLLTPPLLPNEFRHENRLLRKERTAPAVHYVTAHFDEILAEKYLAELCGMSVFVFSKAFRCEHGMTFREFLLRYRIDRAKDLLSNPAMTSTDVAGLVGFNDASSFARIFQRYTGQTPSIYRKPTGHIEPSAKFAPP
jgi:YesN/AraC family two-component response regulator